MNSQQKRQELQDNLANKEAPHFEMNTEEEGDGLPFPVNADSSESDVQSHKFNRESSMKDDEEESKGLPVGAPMIDSESASRSASAAPSHKDQSSSKGAHESSSGLVIDEDDP